MNQEEQDLERLKYYKDDTHSLVIECKKTVEYSRETTENGTWNIKKVTNMPWFLNKYDVDDDLNVVNKRKIYFIKHNTHLNDWDDCDTSCIDDGPCDHNGAKRTFTDFKMKICPIDKEKRTCNVNYHLFRQYMQFADSYFAFGNVDKTVSDYAIHAIDQKLLNLPWNL